MSYKKKRTLQDTLSVPIEETLMNNNIDSVDLEDELYEHFRFEVPKGQTLCELINTLMD
jgi:hypothetical protein